MANVIKLTNNNTTNKPKAFDRFLEEAHNIHGDKYSYDKFIYKNNKTKGLIHCNKCGTDFWMIPTNHLCKKQGCPKCNGTNKIKTEECIERCRSAHGDTYDYSDTEYINGDTKIKIICHKKDKNGIEHGEFWQLPRKHWNGQGCPKCSVNATVDFNEFVRRSNEKHGNFYTYDEKSYSNFTSKTTITCPLHGNFEQTAQAHSLGQGCPKCATDKRGTNRATPFSSFVEKARKVHKNKYEYDENSYKNYTTKVRILCKEHGWFEQMPQKHIERKQGCPKCKYEKQSERQLLTFEEVLGRFKKIHGEKYIYEKSEYKGQNHKMKIICPIHGEFYQSPLKHWIGQGCPKCNQSHLEREIENILKILDVECTYQATKKDLNFLGMMSLDFYIPKYKLAIECQGIQHFEDNGMLKSEKVIERDFIKYNLCKENNIELIYYTNLTDKIHESYFYNDKLYFTDANKLCKFLKEHETAN